MLLLCIFFIFLIPFCLLFFRIQLRMQNITFFLIMSLQLTIFTVLWDVIIINCYPFLLDVSFIFISHSNVDSFRKFPQQVHFYLQPRVTWSCFICVAMSTCKGLPTATTNEKIASLLKKSRGNDVKHIHAITMVVSSSGSNSGIPFKCAHQIKPILINYVEHWL